MTSRCHCACKSFARGFPSGSVTRMVARPALSGTQNRLVARGAGQTLTCQVVTVKLARPWVKARALIVGFRR